MCRTHLRLSMCVIVVWCSRPAGNAVRPRTSTSPAAAPSASFWSSGDPPSGRSGTPRTIICVLWAMPKYSRLLRGLLVTPRVQLCLPCVDLHLPDGSRRWEHAFRATVLDLESVGEARSRLQELFSVFRGLGLGLDRLYSRPSRGSPLPIVGRLCPGGASPVGMLMLPRIISSTLFAGRGGEEAHENHDDGLSGELLLSDVAIMNKRLK